MTAIDRTAYPHVGARLSPEERRARYDLTDAERAFVASKARGDANRLMLATLLKTRSHLGYFAAPDRMPQKVIAHLAAQLDMSDALASIAKSPRTKSFYRQQAAVRAQLRVMPYGAAGERLVSDTILDGAETMSDPADLINRAIEALQTAGIDLPAFSTLDRLVNRLRATVHKRIFRRVAARLTSGQTAMFGCAVGQTGRQHDDRLQPPEACSGTAEPWHDQTLDRSAGMARWARRQHSASRGCGAHETAPVRCRGCGDGSRRPSRHRRIWQEAYAAARSPADGAAGVTPPR